MTTKLANVNPTNSPGRRVGRVVVQIVVPDGANNASADIPAFNGIIWSHLCDIAQCTGATTATLSLHDEDTTSLYSLATISEATKTYTKLTIDTRICYTGTLTVKLTQTNAQSGAAATHNVALYYQCS